MNVDVRIDQIDEKTREKWCMYLHFEKAKERKKIRCGRWRLYTI
jgi:hypothetical protein